METEVPNLMLIATPVKPAGKPKAKAKAKAEGKRQAARQPKAKAKGQSKAVTKPKAKAKGKSKAVHKPDKEGSDEDSEGAPQRKKAKTKKLKPGKAASDSDSEPEVSGEQGLEESDSEEEGPAEEGSEEAGSEDEDMEVEQDKQENEAAAVQPEVPSRKKRTLYQLARDAFVGTEKEWCSSDIRLQLISQMSRAEVATRRFEKYRRDLFPADQ